MTGLRRYQKHPRLAQAVLVGIVSVASVVGAGVTLMAALVAERQAQRLKARRAEASAATPGLRITPEGIPYRVMVYRGKDVRHG